ncbi:S8 family serine peptidase [Ahrensia sp. R2A130]|uniref:S8 family serine peptidase n=1 Tax=Ahrensia sp. R2A130 TaxID=744979 RepID=UPI0001E0E11D|nr:S8 family serine peptidase [Ahrensia sp. R2A130]EFL87564.1 conserved hypothetical protein [Ahrensia sp. R2A130]
MARTIEYTFQQDERTVFVAANGNKSPVRFDDAYSQWSIGVGKDFELIDTITSTDEDDPFFDDFKFYAFLTGLKTRLDATAHVDETFAFQSEAFDKRSDASRFSLPVRRDFLTVEGPGGVVQGDGAEKEQTPKFLPALLSRLPIREAAVSEEFTGDDITPDALFGPKLSAAFDDPEKIVLVGVIDDGINFFHERFQDKHGNSRFDSVWVQDADTINQSFTEFGREFTNSAINRFLLERAGADDFDLLRKAGVVGGHAKGYHPTALQFGGSHGTHVADLAAGYGRDHKDALHRRLLGVQLPLLATLDTSGYSLIGLIIEAVRHIFSRATLMSIELNTALPVVINLSYGFRGGPRNGLHPIERALRAWSVQYRSDMKAAGLQEPSVEVVVPAGNGHLTQSHAASEVGTTNTSELDVTLSVKPDDRTPTFVEIWLPLNAQGIEFSLTLPNAKRLGPINFDPTDLTSASLLMVGDDPSSVIARVKMDEPNTALDEKGLRDTLTNSAHWRILLAIAPTAHHVLELASAPIGDWSINVTARNMAIGQRIQTWIQRDEPVSGFRIGARQAEFVDKDYENNRWLDNGQLRVFDPPAQTIRRDGTLSGIATNPSAEQLVRENLEETISRPTIAVAGYVEQTQSAAAYSASQTVGRKGPVIAAVSDRSPVRPGVIAAGTNSGSTHIQNGTSVAVPQVVRVLADAMAKTRTGFDGSEFLNNSAAIEAESHVRPSKALEPNSSKKAAIETRFGKDIRSARLSGFLLPVHKDLTGMTERETDS